jgi:microcystin-dependent protein
MPRTNSTTWTAGNAIQATRLNQINTDLDDLYSTGSDRLKVYRISTDPALRVTIGAGTYRVGSTEGQYAGGTLTVWASLTTYIMIDSVWTIQTSTSTWNGQYARIWVVISGVSTITSITNWRNDVVGGDFWWNPTWVILVWSTWTAPTGYIMCDGSAVSRTTYGGLFALIGTTYGIGNGSTTFNIPNLKWRVPVGLDSWQTEFDVLGETGGAKTHTLQTTEMPVHNHSFDNMSNNVVSNPTQSYVSHGSIVNNPYPATTANTGWWLSHNNLQPYIVVNYIIKT